MTTPREAAPSAVPATVQPDGKAQDRWSWTEPVVWTQRMLTALDEGVKGGVWFRLIDKVWTERNLRVSYEKVAANRGAPGVDHVKHSCRPTFTELDRWIRGRLRRDWPCRLPRFRVSTPIGAKQTRILTAAALRGGVVPWHEGVVGPARSRRWPHAFCSSLSPPRTIDRNA